MSILGKIFDQLHIFCILHSQLRVSPPDWSLAAQQGRLSKPSTRVTDLVLVELRGTFKIVNLLAEILAHHNKTGRVKGYRSSLPRHRN